MNTATPPIDWMAILAIAISAAVMIFLLRRMMGGMNQQDWILLRQARTRGLNLGQPQSVDFVLFLDSERTAKEVAEELRRDGFEVSTKQAQIQFARRNKAGAPQNGFLVTAKFTLALVPAELVKFRKRLTEIATARKGVYCGWQVSGSTATPPSNAAQK